MKILSIKRLFFSAALFNWLVALALSIDAAWLFALFGVTPPPTEPLFLQLFAWLVFTFGIGYFWVFQNPTAHVSIIKLGILGKISVVLVALACVLTGHISWQMMILASADLVYVVLFAVVLKAVQNLPSSPVDVPGR